MKLDHEKLVEFVKGIKIPKNEIFRKIILLKKREELVRDYLFMAIQKRSSSTTEAISIIEWDIRLEWKKNGEFIIKNKTVDYAILRIDENGNVIPSSLVELKFVMAPLILKSKDYHVDDKERKYNTIWYENKKHESGAAADIEYMLTYANEMEKKGEFVPSIHQIIIMIIPSEPFSNEVRPLLQTDFKEWKPKSWKTEDKTTKDKVCQIMKEQFQKIKSVILKGETFQEDFVEFPLGTIYDRKIDMVMYVITRKET